MPLLARQLKAPDSGPFPCADPCAGKGQAFALLLQHIGGKPLAYAAELDSGRVEEARAALPEATVVGPADFLEMAVSPDSLGLAYTNPPFNTSEFGNGDRVEHEFLVKVTKAMRVGGVLVAIVPEHQVNPVWGTTDFKKHLQSRFTNIICLPLPEEHRPYNEVAVFAVRKPDLKTTVESPVRITRFDAPDLPVYSIPAGKPLALFAKTEPTAQELECLLAASPLCKVFDPPADKPMRRPPLQLGPAHVALMLVSGALDGFVDCDDPHVARGSVAKEAFIKSQSTDVDDDGTETRTTVSSEVPKPKVRAIYPDGRLETYE